MEQNFKLLVITINKNASVGLGIPVQKWVLYQNDIEGVFPLILATEY